MDEKGSYFLNSQYQYHMTESAKPSAALVIQFSEKCKWSDIGKSLVKYGYHTISLETPLLTWINYNNPNMER